MNGLYTAPAYRQSIGLQIKLTLTCERSFYDAYCDE